MHVHRRCGPLPRWSCSRPTRRAAALKRERPGCHPVFQNIRRRQRRTKTYPHYCRWSADDFPGRCAGLCARRQSGVIASDHSIEGALAMAFDRTRCEGCPLTCPSPPGVSGAPRRSRSRFVATAVQAGGAPGPRRTSPLPRPPRTDAARPILEARSARASRASQDATPGGAADRPPLSSCRDRADGFSAAPGARGPVVPQTNHKECSMPVVPPGCKDERKDGREDRRV